MAPNMEERSLVLANRVCPEYSSRFRVLTLAVVTLASCSERPSASPEPPAARVPTNEQPDAADPVGPLALIDTRNTEQASSSLEYLRTELDMYHERLIVFDDFESGGEAYFPSGWMGLPNPGAEDLRIQYPNQGQYRGASCMRIRWTPARPDAWVGVYWQYPEGNWGEAKGRDLRGATLLTFWARGERGGEVAEFKIGGVNRDRRGGPHSDSLPTLTTGRLTLSKKWTKYTIRLNGRDLGNVIGGFCWVASAFHNPKGCVIYLDDVAIDKTRPEAARLIRSFRADSAPLDEMEHLRNVAFTYDNAVAVCALLASGDSADVDRARHIGDAFVLLSEFSSDGTLRSAYSCGDLLGTNLAGERFPRMPGWSNRGRPGFPPMEEVPWLLDSFSLGKDVGNMAWAAIALLNLWEVTGSEPNSDYLRVTLRLADWILEECAEAPTGVGFTGGESWNSQREKFQRRPWQSTEHNIDLAALFTRLSSVTDAAQSNKYRVGAASAKAFVDWAARHGESDGRRLVTGTDDGADAPAMTPKPLDPQTWSVLIDPANRRFGESLDWALTDCRVAVEDLWGIGFSTDSESIWPEGLGQLTLALHAVGREEDAATTLAQLRKVIRLFNLESTVRGVPAAYPTPVDTGFGWRYEVLGHVGATAWHILAEYRYNPFWNRQVGVR